MRMDTLDFLQLLSEAPQSFRWQSRLMANITSFVFEVQRERAAGHRRHDMKRSTTGYNRGTCRALKYESFSPKSAPEKE